jgi:putative metallohydrolase (TIGR04338 family)
VRDNDKQKVYEAEWELRKILDMPRTFVNLHGSTFLVPDERRFGSIESIQSFVDDVLDHVECNRPIKVRVRKGQAQAHYQLGVIAIPEVDRWAMRETVVLHEIAHHLAIQDKHGPVFRKEFTNLFEKVLAPEAALMLRLLYWERGLQIA